MRNVALKMVLNAVHNSVVIFVVMTLACGSLGSRANPSAKSAANPASKPAANPAPKPGSKLAAKPAPKPGSKLGSKSVAQHYPAHTIHFPQQSVGKLFLLRNLIDRGVVQNKPFSLAKGDVEVPAGMLVLLDISYDGGEDLSWTKAIKPDDLQVLYFMRADISEDDCRKLAIMHGIKGIDLRESDVAGKGFKYIFDGMPKLQDLNIARTNASDETLAELAVLKNLESLKVGSTAVTNKGIAQLSGLTQLNCLEFPKTRVTDKALQTVAKLQNLIVLAIDENFIGDEAIVSISKLPKLRDLRMGATRISDAALKTLPSMRTLTNLDLHWTKITSAGVKLLAGSSVASLNLENTLVDDQCVPTLCKMPLSTLDIRSTRITPAGVAKFKAVNKLCAVLVGREMTILPPGD